MMELTTIEAFILAIGALGLGMILLIRGGNWTIDAAIYIARHFGISPLVVGFTVVAFGTSLPELIVSINANFHGSPGIAIGNVLGSNIANILLVLGAASLFATLNALPRRLARDLFVMLGATLILCGLMLYGNISRIAGGLMLAALLAYVLWQYRAAIQSPHENDALDEPVFKSMKISLSFLVGGLAFIAIGAEFLVRGATVGATVIGVPEAVIGLSVIAIGTSLPELSTCIIAARKKQTDLILGNIIGSNVFNIMMIIGITALIKPIDIATIEPQLVNLDIWVTLGVSAFFIAVIFLLKKLTRRTGIFFLGAYCAYIIAIYALYMA